MPVTEFSLLRLNNSAEEPSERGNINAKVLSLLAEVKAAQKPLSGYPVHFFQQIEDPSLIYICGGWTSMMEHYNEWISTEQWMTLGAELGKWVRKEFSMHLDVDPAKVLDSDAAELKFTIFNVREENKVEFEKQVKRTSDTYLCCGWKMEIEPDQNPRQKLVVIQKKSASSDSGTIPTHWAGLPLAEEVDSIASAKRLEI